ncbi:MAG: hypothetical protein MZV64_43020 [Ignavibacteriales bacterium]|nr:hypothetical protein [Ignavibacteriales bacterium]
MNTTRGAQPATACTPVQHVADGALRQEECAAEVRARDAVVALRRRLEARRAAAPAPRRRCSRRGRGGRTSRRLSQSRPRGWRRPRRRPRSAASAGRARDERARLVERVGRRGVARRAGRAGDVEPFGGQRDARSPGRCRGWRR